LKEDFKRVCCCVLRGIEDLAMILFCTVAALTMMLLCLDTPLLLSC